MLVAIHRGVLAGAVLAALLLGCAEHREPRPTPAPSAPTEAGSHAPQPARADDVTQPAPRANAPPAYVPPAGAPDAAAAPIASGVPEPNAAPNMAPDAAAPPEPVASHGQLRVEVLTKASPNSRYEPLNLLAIWVEDEAATPLRVLFWGAGVRGRLLTQYAEHVAAARARAGDAGIPIGLALGLLPTSPASKSNPDIVAGATLRAHELRRASWDMTIGSDRIPAPDGRYTVLIESADELNRPSALTTLPFDKGAAAVAIDLPESDAFGPIALRYTPP